MNGAPKGITQELLGAWRLNPWVLAWLVGLLYGAGARELRRFESFAASDIRSKLEGPAVQVDVHAQPAGLVGAAWGELASVTIHASNFSTPGLPLFTEPERSKKGSVRRLDIVLDNFTLAGLRIDHLEASIPNCRFDFALALRKHQIRLSKSGIGAGYVRILEKDLEAFILAKFHEIKRATVRIDKHKVFVEGYGEFLIVKTNFLVIANLEPVDGTKLALSDAYILFDDRKADPAAAKALLDTLNPVVDLSKDLNLLDAIKIKRLRMLNGVLEAWGDTKIPDMPRVRTASPN